MSRPTRRKDAARTIAFTVLREVWGNGAYANLALGQRREGLHAADAAFVTELVSGTCRALGTYDLIIATASGRALNSLQPAVVDVLRLGTHQLLAMRVPTHAAISATVDLAALQIGERVAGTVNAILRRVAAHDLPGWLDLLSDGKDEVGRLSLTTNHPRWIVDAWSRVLPADELEQALAADNVAPAPCLVVRPGLAERAELGGTPTRWSPFGAERDGDPSAVDAVREGRAGVQDEGSQLVSLALARAGSPSGPWLDLCAGPGGKSALLAGLAREAGELLVASELQPHRARLVAENLRAYPEPRRPVTIVADGTRPAWREGAFSRVLADVPCTGLGALRRRPESRWRRKPTNLPGLVALQRELLAAAIRAVRPGGVVAYVTCSPHPAETVEVVAGATGVEVLSAPEFLPEVPDSAVGDFVQLWPHRHGTDAMFLALLRRNG